MLTRSLETRLIDPAQDCTSAQAICEHKYYLYSFLSWHRSTVGSVGYIPSERKKKKEASISSMIIHIHTYLRKEIHMRERNAFVLLFLVSMRF